MKLETDVMPSCAPDACTARPLTAWIRLDDSTGHFDLPPVFRKTNELVWPQNAFALKITG
jgi:hypothetical protein